MATAVGVGLMEFPFSGPAAFWRWIDLCEEAGIDSFWQTDRMVSGEPMLECMSAMAALAGRTVKLKFGMNVASVALREPVLLAKQIATIDMLSGGRLLPAYGIGSPHSPDWQGLGVSPRRRGRRTDEALEIIARLLSGERFEFEGEFYTCRDIAISPLPVQSKLPLWIGGSSAAAIRRTARIGSGWLGGRETPREARKVVRGVLEITRESGRPFPSDHFGAGFFYRFGREDDAIVAGQLERMLDRFPDRDPWQSLVVGGPAEVLARVQAYVDVGVTKFVLRPLGVDDGDIYAQTRRLAEEVIPFLPPDRPDLEA